MTHSWHAAPITEGAGEEIIQYRPLLFSIAYRMLGSAADAEDIVQEAFLRWQQVDRASVVSLKAYLTTIVSRLCIDMLRSARVRREEYAGPWLPEPIETDMMESDPAVLADSLSLAFLVLLETLTPVERAVFLLHEVFAYPYDEIAHIVDKSEANCRQIAQRARSHIEARRPRFAPAAEQQDRLTRQFVHACATGDLSALLALLAEDVTLWSDGGGKASAAVRPIYGADRVSRFLIGLTAKAPPTAFLSLRRINGELGIVGMDQGAVIMVGVLEVAAEHIVAIRYVRNPDKLRGIHAESIAQADAHHAWNIPAEGQEGRRTGIPADR